MGKATILSGGDDGKYSIKLDYGKAVRDAKLQRTTKLLATLLSEIADAQTVLDAQLVAENVARAAVQVTIESYVAASKAQPPSKDGVNAAQKAYTTAVRELVKQQGKSGALRAKVQVLESQQAQVKKEDAKWRNLELEETRDVWCVDLTEDATGAVATIEIPGESKHFLIAPEAPKPTDADGVVVAREVQSAEQVFFNAAILPGWQKFRPTFRIGTITAIDYRADTADVTLSTDDVSSAQKLGINQTDTLEKVPVEYMTCNTAAFDLGDQCVVQFEEQDWLKPKVIGFFDNPRPCGSGIGIAYVGAEGPEYVVLTPSGTFQAPTGNWRSRKEKSLIGGRYPWAGSQVGDYAVSDATNGDGRKYNGVAVYNKRSEDIALTFGGVSGDTPYVAQVRQGSADFNLYVAASPKRLRSLRSFKPQDRLKAFALDVPPQVFLGTCAGASSDGTKVLGVSVRDAQTPTYLAPIFGKAPASALMVSVALPTASEQEVAVVETVINDSFPEGSEAAPGDDFWKASKSPYAVHIVSTQTDSTSTKTWTRRLDVEFPCGVTLSDPTGGMYLKPDGTTGQDILHLVQNRTGYYNRTGSGGPPPPPYPGGTRWTVNISGSAWHLVTEVLTAEICGADFEFADVRAKDSGGLSSTTNYKQGGSDDELILNSSSTSTYQMEWAVTTRQPLFIDRQFGIIVFQEVVSNVTTSYSVSRSTIYDPPDYNESTTTITKSPETYEAEHAGALVVWQNGTEIYRREVEDNSVPAKNSSGFLNGYTSIRGWAEDDGFIGLPGAVNSIYQNGLHAIFSPARDAVDTNIEVTGAKDPFTGALVVHLNIKNDGLGVSESKWLVFDGSSVKSIAQVSNLTEATVPTQLISV